MMSGSSSMRLLDRLDAVGRPRRRRTRRTAGTRRTSRARPGSPRRRARAAGIGVSSCRHLRRRLRPAAVRVNVEPLPTSLLQLDRAVEHLRQPPADRQAEAGAAVAARRRVVELPEVLEDLRLIVARRCRCRCRAPTIATVRSLRIVRRGDRHRRRRCVNFSALLSRLSTICFTFWRSLLIGRQRPRHLRASRAGSSA